MNRLLLIVCVVLALFATGVSAQQEYQSETKSWRFVCPDGWNQIAFDIIKAREDAERADWPDKQFKYIAAFTRGPMNTMTYPYILINRTDVDLTNVRYEDFEEAWALPDELDSERQMDLALFVYGNFGDKGVVDRDRKRVVATYEDVDDDGKEFQITLYTYLGKTQSIQFECYDLKERGSANLKYFDEFVDSFKMREDLKYVAFEGTSKFDKSNYKEQPTVRGGRRYGRYGFYGFGGIGAMVAILLIWLRRD